ncbi:uncharacterized protein STEHIDRAFT_159691 [Stereum hirsutum FP-91666 SS1]|uniref:uncharacterized protein n=1 Tax=Stereum hirsutum (strain FP-91666) TaxID=721885 RepID=UPI0004449750|nr:uncharacterized protein STEHIDRAFT_159691 [Stereum hirsutum FP-91666 SS1]EIM84094.1 hypothetical protein STEHIDRAFT_159691 [Stereum hirsutum FP-91666 SS1]
MKVLVIGASGRIGSAAVTACLARGHTVTAFLRTPSKLPPKLLEHANIGVNEHAKTQLRIFKGDASNVDNLREAMRDQDAIIQAAVYGSNTPWGTSDSELVVRTIVDVASSIQSQRSSTNPTSEQRSNQRPLRLWLLSGQVLLDIPDGRSSPPRIEGDVLPIHPEHYANYAYVKEHGASLEWSLLCPGKVDDGEPSGPLVHTVDYIPLYRPPGFIGNLPFVGPLFNIIYNFYYQKLTYKSVGEFLADNLGPGDGTIEGESGMRGKRVGLLENWEVRRSN